jgi:hypothetical protein
MTAAKLTFQTLQTTYGLLHTMRAEREDGPVTEYRVFPAKPAGVKWAGPVYLAANGSAWRVGRCNSGALIAWKTTKISKRFGQENYRMRSVQGGYKGDYVKSWSRAFNGKTRSFSKILWNGGKDGWTVRVYEGQSTTVLHEWSGK